jgi:hypothetical protein
LIFREIAKTFEYVLKYQELHQRLITQFEDRHKYAVIKNQEKKLDSAALTEYDAKLEIISDNTEERIIQTIVQIGRSTRDTKTTMSVATSLAHISEVLNCSEATADGEAIEFMISMLKDTKNMKHHRQACRYFANLSFYAPFRDSCI